MSQVLITGGAGFIGSHLADVYLARGHDVTVLDDLSSGNERNLEAAGRTDRCRIVIGDVRDEELVRRLVEQSDLVFHLAARIGLMLVVESALRTLETNVEGTQVVLRHAAKFKRRILVASTSEVYGLTKEFPSREDDPITIGSPEKNRWSYACSKMVDEFAALAYHREQGLPAFVVRLFNTVGPRQSARYGMVMPRFVRQALAGEPLTVYGDGTQSRCFCHVGEVVDALMKLVDCPAAMGKVVNIGNPQQTRILDLARRVIETTNSSSTVTFVPFDQAYEANFEEIVRRVPHIGRARELIGFSPSLGLDAILSEVIAEQRANAMGPAAVPA
jgi:UDP-glucose 4-epimerase